MVIDRERFPKEKENNLLIKAHKKFNRMIESAEVCNIGQLEVIYNYGQNFCKMYKEHVLLVYDVQQKLNTVRSVLGRPKW